MVVVVANVADEEGPFGCLGEAGGVAEGGGCAGGPPGIEVATSGAAEARTPPTAVEAVGGLIVEPAFVDNEALEQEGGPLADGLVCVLAQLFEEVGVAEQRVSWARCLEIGVEEG